MMMKKKKSGIVADKTTQVECGFVHDIDVFDENGVPLAHALKDGSFELYAKNLKSEDSGLITPLFYYSKEKYEKFKKEKEKEKELSSDVTALRAMPVRSSRQKKDTSDEKKQQRDGDDVPYFQLDEVMVGYNLAPMYTSLIISSAYLNVTKGNYVLVLRCFSGRSYLAGFYVSSLSDTSPLSITSELGSVMDKRDEIFQAAEQLRRALVGEEIRWKDLEPYPLDQDVLRPGIELKKYQLKALTWMKLREEARTDALVEEKMLNAVIIEQNAKARDKLFKQPLHQGRGGLIADDMGLGKTLETLAYIWANIKNSRGRDYCVILAPPALLGNWEAEIRKMLNVDLDDKENPEAVIRLSTKARNEELRRTADFSKKKIILASVHINSITMGDFIKEMKGDMRYLVVDEAHCLAGRAGFFDRIVALREAQNPRPVTWLLTGTPVLNGLKDLSAYYTVIGFTPYNLEELYSDDKPELMPALDQFYKSTVLRRSKEEIFEIVDDKTLYRDPDKEYLTKKERVTKMIELSDEENKFYNKEILEERKRRKESGNKGSAIQFVNRMQIFLCTGVFAEDEDDFGLFDDDDDDGEQKRKQEERELLKQKQAIEEAQAQGYRRSGRRLENLAQKMQSMSEEKKEPSPSSEEDSPKVDTPNKYKQLVTDIKKFIDKAENNGSNIIVFTYRIPVLRFLQKRLKEEKDLNLEVSTLFGGTKDKDDVVRSFQERGGPQRKLLIASIRVASVGFTLTSATLAIFYQTGYSAADINQGMDRIHRLGQTKNVQILIYFCKCPIEERIKEILQRKLDAQSHFLSSVSETDGGLDYLKKQMESEKEEQERYEHEDTEEDKDKDAEVANEVVENVVDR